jgi:hypothetical protein
LETLLGNAKRVLKTFSAMLEEQRRHLGKYANKMVDLLGAFPIMSADVFIGCVGMRNPLKTVASQ